MLLVVDGERAGRALLPADGDAPLVDNLFAGLGGAASFVVGRARNKRKRLELVDEAVRLAAGNRLKQVVSFS